MLLELCMSDIHFKEHRLHLKTEAALVSDYANLNE